MKYDEAASQRAVIKWWDLACKAHRLKPQHLLHIPNEGKRSQAGGANLKSLGLRPGAPDLFLMAPRHGKHGLFVEMKSAEGRMSQEQDDYLCLAIMQGYEHCVCRSFDAAKTAIENYLRTGNTSGFSACTLQ